MTCICAYRPHLSMSVHIHLLVHLRELSKATNTGHLVCNSIVQAQYHIWSRIQAPSSLLAALLLPNIATYLVFPGQEGEMVQREDASGLPIIAPTIDQATSQQCQLQFIFLDATWQQARKMLRHSPYLQALPVLSLPRVLRSNYSLRRGQREGNLATAEAVVALLRQLGYNTEANTLDAFYQRFLRHFQASRSGHSVSL